MATDLTSAREIMQRCGVTGWLTRDYRYTNPVFYAALGVEPPNLTRPVWLWIPAEGETTLIAHEVDAKRFPEDTSPEVSYASREQLLEHLRRILPSSRTGKVAMEYSPNFELPRVARVDAGTVELIRSFGYEVVSSANIAQYATERWSEAQLSSHHYAMEHLVDTMHAAFDFVGQNVGWKLTEHDLAQFILGRFDRAGLVTDEGPAVAFNENSSDPHYEPTADLAATIRREGWLLIDAWAKAGSMSVVGADSTDEPVYADITWVAKIGTGPTPRQQLVFDSVKRARDAAFRWMRSNIRSGTPIQGWQVDSIARDSVRADGFGDCFVHRLGHSLGKSVHSEAVNLDDWETHDTRSIIPGIGLTIEPGIYLPEFGVRLEMDVHVETDDVVITGERQDEMVRIET